MKPQVSPSPPLARATVCITSMSANVADVASGDNAEQCAFGALRYQMPRRVLMGPERHGEASPREPAWPRAEGPLAAPVRLISDAPALRSSGPC